MDRPGGAQGPPRTPPYAVTARAVTAYGGGSGGREPPPDVDVLAVFVAVLVAFVTVLVAFVAVFAVSTVSQNLRTELISPSLFPKKPSLFRFARRD